MNPSWDTLERSRQARLERAAPWARGREVAATDVGELLINKTALNKLPADLKAIVEEHGPDVIMVKMDHGKAVLPGDDTWGDEPVYGQIGVSAYIVRREVWQAHAGALVPGWYGSDYSLINSIFGNNPAMAMAPWVRQPRIYWHDCIASRVQIQSFGQAEQ